MSILALPDVPASAPPAPPAAPAVAPLRAQGLTVHYTASGGSGLVVALDALDLTVAAGEVFCLLGANGAGKTTTLNCFLGFVRPAAGRALVGGVDAAQDPLGARRRLAYIPETVQLYPALTGLENLAYLAELGAGRRFGDDELLAHLADAGLAADAARRRVGGYSKGMRQKVGVALALAKGAAALLLDEPTSGLDPKASNEFSALLAGLAAPGDGRPGAAILMATHDLFRAKEGGTRVGIMRRGRLLAVHRTADLTHAELEALYLAHMQDAPVQDGPVRDRPGARP